MHILVFGAGAVGGYFGGRLAQAGRNVTFIARGQHLRAMQRDGLSVRSIEGDFTIHPIRATADPSAVEQADAVLVTVKAWQVPDAAAALRPLMGPGTFVVPLENGVEAPAQLAEILGTERVLGGMCKIISTVAEPGHIHHRGISPLIAFGELNGRRSQRAERLLEAFAGTQGIKAMIPPDIQAAMWEKFLFIAPFSGLGALTRAPIGVLRSLPETRGLLEKAMREIVVLAQSRGVHLGEEAVDEAMAFVDSLPAQGTASMQRDVMTGRPSELEAQNGAVVRLAREEAMDAPTHRFIYAALLPQELASRQRSRPDKSSP